MFLYDILKFRSL